MGPGKDNKNIFTITNWKNIALLLARYFTFVEYYCLCSPIMFASFLYINYSPFDHPDDLSFTRMTSVWTYTRKEIYGYILETNRFDNVF